MVGKKVDKLRIAMIGCGNFARNFVPLFCKHPAVESVCVCDLIPSRAKEYSEEFGVPIIESFEAALESDKINAVAIFATNSLQDILANLYTVKRNTIMTSATWKTATAVPAARNGENTPGFRRCSTPPIPPR